MNCQVIGAWLGLGASAAGIFSALYFARAAGRTFDDQKARDALVLLENAFKTNAAEASADQPSPTAQATKDLTDDILRKNRESQRDMKIGARLLLAAFVFLVVQSLTMFCAPR